MSDELSVIPKKPTYEELRTLEQYMVDNLEPVEAPITHHFADGVYGREMFIPAGTLLTGKIHRFSTLNILAQGEIAVTNEDGAVRVLKAPAIFVSPPGCKKVGYAITDTVWVNVHPTRIQDVAAIEQKFIVPEQPLIGQGDKECLGAQSSPQALP